jgi:hypothetical protein
MSLLAQQCAFLLPLLSDTIRYVVAGSLLELFTFNFSIHFGNNFFIHDMADLGSLIHAGSRKEYTGILGDARTHDARTHAGVGGLNAGVDVRVREYGPAGRSKSMSLWGKLM